jgi:sugar phosphate isomerase/epimerase
LTAEPPRQIELLKDLGIDQIDLRGAWGTDVLDLDRERLTDLVALYKGAGIRISCLATRIGKRTPAEDTATLEPSLARAFALAELFGVRQIRVFGFLATPGEEADSASLRQAVDRLGAFAASARRGGFTLLLETERGLVIDGPDRALEVLRAVDSPALRYIWDPGNMVDLGIVRPTELWFDRLVPYVEYVHVKDGKLGSASTCYPGAGDGQIPELVARLCARSYAGVLSLEPNVARLAELDGDRVQAVSGALQALRALIRACAPPLEPPEREAQ